MARPLIVPMSVEALCVDGTVNPGEFAGPAADFSDFPLSHDPDGPPYLAGTVNQLPEYEPEAGIHLHWALPDALTHGTAGEDGAVAFPAVPTRWLVTRLARETALAGAAPRVDAWVVESDAVSEAQVAGSPTFPYRDPAGRQYFRYLGRAVPYGQWNEGNARVAFRAVSGRDGGPGRPLTALGWGKVGFAAYYPNCRNVFGFHDALEGLATRTTRLTLTYVVSGWYDAIDEDPLTGDVAAAMAAARWSLAAGSAMPDRVLCSGAVLDVSWSPDGPIAPLPAAPVAVVIGNNSAECIAAALAHLHDAKLEFRLNALQQGLVPGSIAQADGLARLEHAMHAASFAPSGSGWSWTVRRMPAEHAAPLDAAATQADPPAEAADPLAALNAAQAAFDAERGRLAALRRRLYHDWYRRVQVRHEREGGEIEALVGDQVALLNAAYDRISRQAGELEDAARRCGELTPDGLLRGAQHSLAASIAGSLEQLQRLLGPNLRLQALPAARYWQPVDPVLMLCGPDVEPPSRYGGDTRYSEDGRTLPCRTFEAPADGVPPWLAGQDFGRAPFPRELALLVAEAARAGASRPVPGVCPLAHTRWERRPWIPLYLEWEVRFRSSEPGDLAAEPDTYRGIIALAGTARIALARVLADALARERARDPKDQDPALLRQLEDLARSVTGLQALAQSLSGLHQGLLGRDPSIQLDVFDAGSDQGDFDQRVRAAVGAGNDCAPAALNAFHPLRAGELELARVRILDAFGQIRELPVDAGTVVRSAGLRPAGEPATGGPARLAPRIVQPARLQLRWQAGDGGDSVSHPDASPVYGWISVNYFDDDLVVHHADGHPLGVLRAADGGGVRFQPLPEEGAPLHAGEAVGDDAVQAIADPSLREFVTGFLRHPRGAAFLVAFLGGVDRALGNIVPAGAQARAIASLVARPLALARATVRLELEGLPATDLGWDAFAAEMRGDAPDDRGLTSVRFHVRLGHSGIASDGLVGYFRHRGDHPEASDYRRFHLSATSDDADVPAIAEAPLSVSCGDRRPERLTLVLDPHGEVHAACHLPSAHSTADGVLPVKAIDLPGQFYADALQALTTAFLVNPALGTDALALPVPQVKGYSWLWLRPEAGRWASTPLGIADTRARFDPAPQQLQEGWLRLVPHKENA